MDIKDTKTINIAEMEIAAIQKPSFGFNRQDIAFALAMLIIGFLYSDLIQLYMLGSGVTLFAVVIFTVSFIYFVKSEVRQNAGSIICLVLAGLSAIQFAIFDNQFIKILNFMFLSVLFIYWICLSTGRRLDNKLSVYIIGDAIKQVFSMPFHNFGRCANSIVCLLKYKKYSGILAAIIGVVFFLPLMAIVINLLTSADIVFESFIHSLTNLISLDKIATYIWHFIFGIPVAFYLYGLIYGNVKGRYVDLFTTASFDNAAKSVRIAPRITIMSALTVFNLIYLLFFVVQASYLFSAFKGNLPELFTYAEYARRGFFELCTVAGINLGILVISHMAVKRELGEEPKALRIETAGISLFTILLIATALSKMVMYINAYGLTQLRVFTSWFMILLLIVFLIISIRQFKKFNSVKSIIIGSVLMFLLLIYSNVDGFIAKYNIERYEAGTLTTIDIRDFSFLSDAAVPHLYGLYLRTAENDTKIREELVSVIMYGKSYEDTGLRNYNLQRKRADEIRATLPSYLKF
jgi:hypothetical protein